MHRQIEWGHGARSFSNTLETCWVWGRRWASVFVTNPSLKDRKSNTHRGSELHPCHCVQLIKREGLFLANKILVWVFLTACYLFTGEIKSVFLRFTLICFESLAIETKDISQRISANEKNYWWIKKQDRHFIWEDSSSSSILPYFIFSNLFILSVWIFTLNLLGGIG